LYHGRPGVIFPSLGCHLEVQKISKKKFKKIQKNFKNISKKFQKISKKNAKKN